MIETVKTQRRGKSEDGYVLVAVIFMMVILILSLAVAIPKVREDIQRDRDQETMQRGKQYIRAIQLYYRKFHAYPPNLDALVKTNDIRFLRKRYIDPTTGKDDWKPIMWGQNKTPLVMGFFGQAMAVTTGSGIGPSGGNTGLNGTNTPGGGGLFNSSSTGSTDSGASATGQTGTDANGNPPSGTTGGTDSSGSSGATGTSNSTGSSTSNGSGFGSSNNPAGSGQTFGGGGIIGFSPASPKESIYVYKKKNHYNEWEFLYSPQMDQQTVGGGNTGMIGQPASGTTNPIGGGNSSNSSGTSTTTTTPTSPTTPQQ